MRELSSTHMDLSPDAGLDRQLRLEADMLHGGIHRYRQRRQRSVSKAQETAGTPERTLLTTFLDNVSRGVEKALRHDGNTNGRPTVFYTKLKTPSARYYCFYYPEGYTQQHLETTDPSKRRREYGWFD